MSKFKGKKVQVPLVGWIYMFLVQHVERQLQENVWKREKFQKAIHWFAVVEMYSELRLEHFFLLPTRSFSLIGHELSGDRSHAGVGCSFHMSSDIFASLSLRRHCEGPAPRCQTQPRLRTDFSPSLLVFDPNGGVSVCLLTAKRAPATAFISTALCGQSEAN